LPIEKGVRKVTIFSSEGLLWWQRAADPFTGAESENCHVTTENFESSLQREHNTTWAFVSRLDTVRQGSLCLTAGWDNSAPAADCEHRPHGSGSQDEVPPGELKLHQYTRYLQFPWGKKFHAQIGQESALGVNMSRVENWCSLTILASLEDNFFAPMQTT
jgi:hypothetical protein